MKKEFTKIAVTVTNESGEVIQTEENTFVSLIADKGKRIREKATGITGTRVDVGNGNESDYEEIDDPNIQSAIDAILTGVSEI
ncbi:hypothetical protein AALA24_02050 [Anaerovoracaceae bacterium 42-11]